MATELGKAYVQIIPSAKGIKGGIESALGSDLGASASKIGAGFGKKLALSAGLAIVGVGLGKVISASITEGAKLQQSKGGIETLFKDQAKTVQKNAQQAFKTVGMSANQYMETVTSFSAGLLQSLGGDTKKSAQIADMAMRDMGDNANKFGTDMASIQTAYQGFARGQYTLLDNLKLGYGGTKTEMERLLKDAQNISGQKYDINNLADVYEAIHVIQKEMGVTGTTAKEASTTFAGSFNAMKASAQNLLGALAMGENIQPALEGLVSSTVTFLGKNLLPMVGTILKSLVQMIADNIGTVPSLIDRLGDLILAKAPSILNAGLLLITQLAVAIVNATPKIIKALGTLILKAVAGLLKGVGKFLSIGAKFVASMVQGVKTKANSFISNLGGLGGKALRALRNALSGLPAIGADIVRGLWTGASGMISWAVSQFAGLGKSILGGIKRALGIKSPSKVFADEVGKMIPLGIAEGVKKNASAVNDALTGMMADAMPSVQTQLDGFASRRTALPGVANSVVNGMATLQGASGGQQISFRPNIYLWPNGAKAGKDLYEIQTEWGNRLNG